MAEIPLMTKAKSFLDKLSTAQKSTIGIAIVAAVVGIVLLVTSLSKTEMGVLYTDLEQQDAAQIVEKLKEQNIPYELSNNGSTVSIQRDKIHETRLVFAKDGIPVNSTVGYEIFDKTNLGMSDFVQKLNYKRAIEGELQKTIGSMDEVQKVRVMLVMPEKTLFDKDQKKPTAAVHLHLKNGRNVGKLDVEGIQNLVAQSVEGLNLADVTIVDQRGQILSEVKKDKSSLAGLSSTQYEQQQKVDEYLISKVQSALNAALGPNNAAVQVSAELDFTQVERVKENYDPDGQVILSEERKNEKSKSMDSLNYPSVNSESDKGVIGINYQNSKTVEKIVEQVGAVKRISSSVVVNGISKVVEENGKSVLKYTPRSDEDMQKITQIVRNAIGFDPQRNDQVSVVNMAFDNTAQEEELRMRSDEKKLPVGDDIIQIILIAVAVLISVLMIRKLFSSQQLRRRIEEIIAPPVPKSLTPLPPLPSPTSGLMIGPDGTLIAIPNSNLQLEENSTAATREDLEERARRRLDQLKVEDIDENQLIIDEMKKRIQSFFTNEDENATQILTLLMAKNSDPVLTRNK